MIQSSLDYKEELQTPFMIVVLTLGALGVFFALTSDVLFGSKWDRISEVGLLCCATAVVAWFLQYRWPNFSRWMTVVSIAMIVLFASRRLEEPTLVSWLVLPNILAVAFFNFPSGTGMAVIETGLIFLLHPGIARTGPGQVALGIIWTSLMVITIFTYSLRHVIEWSLGYYKHAMSALKDARNRQAELNQALSDLASANQQMVQLNRLAHSLRQIADDSRRTKEQFVANVSHELRTPLNMIIGFSEMILETPTAYGNRIPPSLLADLRVIYRNAQHLSSLIDDVLDLSQIDAQEMALTKEYVLVEQILDNALTAVKPLYESKNLILQTEIEDGIPPVFCDATRICEVLMNLLSNAGRFTEYGGVKIRAWSQTALLYISVSDTGPGISEEGLRNLFQPFYQVDGSIRRRFGGTGLGLSISKRLVDLHDGKIWVESTEGAGTTFTFSIPLSPANLPSNVLQKIMPEWEFHHRDQPSAAPKLLSQSRFVILENGKTLTRLVRRYINNHETVSFHDLNEALADLRKNPALALLVNAPSVCNALETLSPSAVLPYGLPAFICSIPDPHEDNDHLGVADRLVKPISREALVNALLRLGITSGTILIVDDEPDALQLFGRMLASAGNQYRTLIARDGRELLEILKETHPDVILLDLIMPTMDGFQFLEERNNHPEIQDIPIIIISAQDASRQPIVSSAYALTRGGGISVAQLLEAIHFTSHLSALNVSNADPERSETAPG
jgi:signal transduction histidine kinase/CheY-like chemotaxis protein